MTRLFNFSAGPSNLPEAVLQEAQSDLLNWQGKGMSVMEMSHRGEAFTQISEEAESDLRALLAIPDHYKVLFLQGGASSQFAMVPLNLLRGNTQADYVNTGAWSKKAIAEAKKYCEVNVVASAEDKNFTYIPPQETWQLNPKASYVHYTPNETIGGVEFSWVPETGGVPLVADMSSTLLSRPINIEQYGIIYAGAQKNIGPAGLTLVIIREDLLGHAIPSTPTMFDYKTHAENDSKYNTPPAFAWYIAGLVFKWMKEQGGLAAMAEVNERKAAKLYQAIEESELYTNPVNPANRSWMNVPFILKNSELDKPFLAEAKEAGLVELKGHRSVGGMRASIYNAMPEAGVDALITFMKAFEQKHA